MRPTQRASDLTVCASNLKSLTMQARTRPKLARQAESKESTRARSSPTPVRCLLTLARRNGRRALANNPHATRKESRPRVPRGLTWLSTTAQATRAPILAALLSTQEALIGLRDQRPSRKTKNNHSRPSSRSQLKVRKSRNLPRVARKGKMICPKRTQVTKALGTKPCLWKRDRMTKVAALATLAR